MNKETVKSAEKPAIKRIKSLPPLSVAEGEELTLIDLNDYIKNPKDKLTTFEIEFPKGEKLPEGLEFTEDGLFYGAPAENTARDKPYPLLFIAKSKNTAQLTLSTTLTITPAKVGKEKPKPTEGYTVKEFWKAFFEGEFLDLTEILTRKITPLDIYYLLSRFATLTIWNADDLSPTNMGKLITIKNASPDFLVFDFGVALVATPKDLFDHNRTVKQALQTARAMVDECRRRGWNIEMAGFDKMVTAAWVHVQEVNRGLSQNKQMKILHYEPTTADQGVLVNQQRLEERLKA